MKNNQNVLDTKDRTNQTLLYLGEKINKRKSTKMETQKQHKQKNMTKAGEN